jgi:DNA phosphorothioation-dependent restriction protein DptG
MAWLAHAGAANRLSVYPSQGCMGNQALVQTSVLATYEFAYACAFGMHTHHMSNIGGRNSKAVCFQVEPSKQSKRRASGRMFRMHRHL